MYADPPGRSVGDDVIVFQFDTIAGAALVKNTLICHRDLAGYRRPYAEIDLDIICAGEAFTSLGEQCQCFLI